MDILDVGLTMKEFSQEWHLKYTPADVAFWGPLLDSEFPIQQACAMELFSAWGRPKMIEHYETWKALQARKKELEAEYKKSKRDFERNFYDDLDEEQYYYESSGGFRRTVRTGTIREAKFRSYYDDTEYQASKMTWPEYFKSYTGLKES